jgi:hypothetical protein
MTLTGDFCVLTYRAVSRLTKQIMAVLKTDTLSRSDHNVVNANLKVTNHGCKIMQSVALLLF